VNPRLQTVLLAGTLAVVTAARATTLEIQADQPGAKINPAMWGIFFEDINFGADGGLYAELVKNRGFEFPDAMMGWFKLSPSKARGELSIREAHPFNAANPHYLHIESEGTDLFGVANEGFRGMGVKQGDAYNFSAQIRRTNDNTPHLFAQSFRTNRAGCQQKFFDAMVHKSSRCFRCYVH